MTDRYIHNKMIFSVSPKHIALVLSNFGTFYWPKNGIEFQSGLFSNAVDGERWRGGATIAAATIEFEYKKIYKQAAPCSRRPKQR